jgi:hypothetical protein
MSEKIPQPDHNQATAAVIGAEHAANDYPGIADLINIDSRDRGHIANSYVNEGQHKGRRNGQFISRYQMEQIVANQDAIRDNLPKKVGQVDSPAAKPVELDQVEPVMSDPEVNEKLVPNYVAVNYEEDEGGIVQRGREVTQAASVVNWDNDLYARDISSRQMVVHTAGGNRYYVNGSRVYDLDVSREAGKPVWAVLEEGEKLPVAVVGASWGIGHPLEDTPPIEKVEWSTTLIAADELAAERAQNAQFDADHEKRGTNPFAAAAQLLHDLESQKPSVSAVAEESGDEEDPEKDEPRYYTSNVIKSPAADKLGAAGIPLLSRRDRIKQRLGDASRQVRGLGLSLAGRDHDPLAVKSSEEAKQSKRRKITIGVVGALLVGAVAGGIFAEHESSHNTGSTMAARTTAHKTPMAIASHGAAAHGAGEQSTSPTSIKLIAGDTIWHEASQQLQRQGNAQPSAEQIVNDTQRILDTNHMSWEQARHLTKDSEIKL